MSGAAQIAETGERPADDATTVVAPVLTLGTVPAPIEAEFAQVSDVTAPQSPIAEASGDEADEVTSAPLVLRLLTGPLEGADAVLAADDAITVGRGFRNDVVLRDKAVGDARVRIEADAAAARLSVLSGEVVLLGQRLAAPAEAVLPHYLPLAIGASSLAVGGADEARWADASALVPHVTAAPANDAAPQRRSGARWIKDVAVGVGAFGALAACTVFLAPGEEDVFATPVAETVRGVVEAGGYDEVLVTARGEGERVLVQGFVATDARHATLRTQLDALGVEWDGQVRSGEAAARQVRELFASNGLPAEAVYGGGGTVAVTGVEADQATADRVGRSALSDVPYLADITVAATEAASTFPSEVWTSQIEKVVGGDFAYVVTRDGERHFEGASTPQGGKIVAINEGEVTIEDGGEAMTYTF